ncbi:MAG TPA: hypothetical protein VI146_05840 [Nitrososphaeraceae archaeon]
MRSTIVFVTTSLILVAAIVTVAMSNAVYAVPVKHVIQYCIKGVIGSCQPTKALCNAQITTKGEKCIRVVS